MKDGSVPKWLEKAFYLYPAIHAVVAGCALLDFINDRSLGSFIWMIFVFYLISPLIWRFFLLLFGKPQGKVDFGKYAKRGSMWFIAHQLQSFYTFFHYIERSLILLPGLYSSWLRLWGANIGKKVIWTPETLIVDRPHLKIGDRVLVGNRTYISAHYIKKEDKKYKLIVADVTIGNDCVLAYECTIAPGAVLEDKVFIEAGGAVYPNMIIPQGTKYERFKELLDDRFDFVFKEFKRRSSS